jgi:hypothetical protein
MAKGDPDTTLRFAMPDTKHTLRVDNIGGELVATCPCGKWTQRYPMEDDLKATFDRIDVAHAEHVATGTRAR